ncbi:MAG: ATPase [Bacteroidales bacterium]|nr:ATPase [Bacteroidales bacterium]
MKAFYPIGLALVLAASVAPSAQADEPQLKVTPTGRVLVDGALYSGPDRELFKDGAAIPDVRMGVKASYGKWSGKVDIGYSMQTLGLKDIFIQYTFNPTWLVKVGNFTHQYGLQSSTSSSMKASFEEPLSNTVFNAARQIGVMGVYSGQQFFGTFSAHAEPKSIKQTPDEMNHQGWGFCSRLVARPFHTDDGTVFQIGISGAYVAPQTEGDDMPHEGFTMAGNFPTRVDRVVAAEVDLTNARNMWKFTPELVVAKGPLAVEAQYFFNRVNMHDGLHNFTGQGAYVILRGLILGQHYGYSMSDCGLATPKPGSFEFVALYNYTSLSDSKAQWIDDDGAVCDGIFGGRVNTLSATLNYYINPYMLVRFNYAYTHRWNASDLPRADFNAFQVRIQILF